MSQFLPAFSAVCLTYARPERLAEAIECFLRQDYTGPKELLVFNTFPDQKIVCDKPGVRIVNCVERPLSLGEARNAAISMADNEWIVTWDDDDIYLPRHFTNFAEAIRPDRQWVWMDKAFGASRFQLTHLRSGQTNTFAFTRKLWKECGGYPPRNGDEDAFFVTKASAAGHGARFSVPDERASFIYSWNNGVQHISAAMNNKISPIAYRMIAQDAERRLRGGRTPGGEVVITPKWERDWTTLAQQFLARRTPRHNNVHKKDSICIIQLGRYGDIINALPIAQHIAEQVGPPTFMVAKEFASVLDGVSYVTPHVANLQYNQINDATRIAQRIYKRIILSQIHGTNYTVRQECPSFTMESWRLAGMLHRFDDRTLRPVFDLRVPGREAMLLKLFSNNGKPNLLINFRASTSTPFPRGLELEERVKARFGEKFNLVDLADVRGERFFDLLGLMEQASGLVSIDTGLVHLAGACNVPVVAIVPNSWAGAIPRCNLSARLTSDAVFANPEILDEAILQMPADVRQSATRRISVPPTRTIYHCVERHAGKDYRKERAQKSWNNLYQRGVVPMHLWQYPRNAKQTIGDPRELPYLKDVLAPAVQAANDDDIIMLTNDDNMLHPELVEELQLHIGIYEAACSFRCEWHGPMRIEDSPEFWRRHSRPHIGRDLFAFTKRWLASHWGELPDFLLGASEWDLCLAAMIRLSHSIASTPKNIIQPLWPSEMNKGYVGHEAHAAFWSRKDNEHTAPSQIYNRTLFREWAKKHRTIFKFNDAGACCL